MKHSPLHKSLIRVLCTILALGLQIRATQRDESTLLETGKTVESQLAGGESREYRFSLQAGQYINVAIEQRSIDVSIACFGPDGRELLSANVFEIGDAESAELIADASGNYRLRITASDAHAPSGRYEITLRNIETATEHHKRRVAAARSFAEAWTLYRQDTREAMLKAISHLEDALAERRADRDLIEEARTLYTLGQIYIEIGDKEKATKYTTDALSIAQASNDRKVEAHALKLLGEVQHYFGDKRKAIQYYEQALPLMRAVGDRAAEAHTTSNMGVAYSNTGEKRKALALYDAAAKIFRELQNRSALAEVTGNMGVTYDLMGEYQRALENHQSVLAINRELRDRNSEAVALTNIGNAYGGLGEFQKALDAYTEALAINRSLDNRRSQSISLNNIAWVHSSLGDDQRALKVHQESLDISRAVKDQRGIAISLNNVAAIYSELGDYRKALELHNEALPLRRAVGDVDGEANSLNNSGKTYMKLGELERARDHFERALAFHRSSGNLLMLSSTLRNLGALHLETHDQRAVAELDEALQLSRTIHDPKGAAEALTGLARAARDRGNFAEMHERAADALAALESVRLGVASPTLRASFFASARDARDLDIEALMHLHAARPDEGFGDAALVVSERGKARSLLELLGENGAEIRRGVDATLLDRERKLESLISAKANQQMRLLAAKHSEAEAKASAEELDDLTAELEQIQSRIRQTSPQYSALTQPVPLNVKEIQTSVLDKDTVLLEYALGERKSFLWLVTPASVDIFELPPRAEVESAAKQVYELLTARNQSPRNETASARAIRVRRADATFLASAAKVSDMLLGPAAAQIEDKRLLIVGEGILQYLPFAALPEPGRKATGKDQPSPLMAAHEIITIPSASVVALLRRETTAREQAPKTLAVLADPVFSANDPRVAQQNKKATAAPQESMPSDAVRSATDLGLRDFVRLRFSRTEAESIARLAPGAQTLKALDFAASRDNVLNTDLGQYRILHFATHSLLNNEHPELSGVVLSLVDQSGRPQNGFLRLYDIYNLRLGSDLVVLSACQTALGRDVSGEGLIGLTRGFLYAGARRVVASLWQIDDRTSAELMRQFYEGMLVRGDRPAAALRSAQLAMWKTRGWETPYYWAAFTLQGEWR